VCKDANIYKLIITQSTEDNVKVMASRAVQITALFLVGELLRETSARICCY